MAGKMGNGSDKPHVHDFDQVIFLAGSNMDDIGDLNAEVELCIGEDLETHVITTTTTVAIPKGMPHFPLTVNRLDKRFIYAEVSVTPEYSERVFETDKKPTPPVDWGAKTRKQIIPTSFIRKGAWNYGPTNRDDGGGYLSFISTNDQGVDMMIIYENMKKAPYRLGPNPDKPHAHPTVQVMCFVGMDTDDLGELGAEFEICVGKELEKYSFTRSTAVITPPNLPHWPGGLLKIDKPIVMVDFHPLGNKH